MGVIRVGIWGIGSHAMRSVIPAFRRSIQAELIAVHTRDSKRLSEASTLAGAAAYTTAEEMLAVGDIDCVYVGLPTGEHFESGLRVIAAGKELWCEKPLTATLDETTELLAAARNADVSVREVDMFLHHPQFAHLRDLVDRDEHGAVKTITARFGFPHLDRENFRYSVRGGGALLDAGFYPIAAVNALCKSPVSVEAATLEVDRQTGLDLGGSALVRSADGVTAFLDWGFGRAYRNEIEIWFERALAVATRVFSKPVDLETHVSVISENGTRVDVKVEPADQFALMLDTFADTAENRRAVNQIVERAQISETIRILTSR